ncbi:hypothetical protein CMEL01_01250 [Colletotrichum melonis]|uniref:Uncharacterized protein n=1 Tax=Colletotrichum melonis TaxID=1209925 RepID=A0AAI9Y2Y8_9PEZI|nr:hypothetical protein CMEL01_01250 [Colletotrichum melonis]
MRLNLHVDSASDNTFSTHSTLETYLCECIKVHERFLIHHAMQCTTGAPCRAARLPPSPSLFFVPAAHRSSHLPRCAAIILVMIDTGKAHPLICSRTSPISCLAASVDPDRTLCPPPHLYLLSLSSALDSYLSLCHPYLSAIGASQPSDVCRTQM